MSDIFSTLKSANSKGKTAEPSTSSSTITVESVGATSSGIPEITREHATNYNPTVNGVKNVIDDVMKTITSLDKNGASRNDKSIVSKQKNYSMKDARERRYKRSPNKQQKDASSVWIADWLKSHPHDKAKLFTLVSEYSKVYSFEIAKNKTLLDNAIKRAKEVNQSPTFYAERMGQFLEEYKVLVLPILNAYINSGMNVKFFSWGVLMEQYKEDYKFVMTEAIKNIESLRPFYGPTAFYGVTVDEAAQASKRIIWSVIVVCHAMLKDKIITPDDLKNKNLTNDEVFKKFKDSEINLKSEIAITDVIKDNNPFISDDVDVGQAAVIACGIAPHAPSQSYEYKIATSGAANNPAVISKTYKAVAMNFNLIRGAYSKMTGVPTKYEGRIFKDVKGECYNMWRPMFVVARVARSFIYPQVNLNDSSKFDIYTYVDAADLNEDSALDGMLDKLA